MKENREKQSYDVAIVGGGFSGIMLAVNMLKRSSRKITIAVIDRSGRPGRGIAYGTKCNEHLLNVSAGEMSAFPEEPGHFIHWLKDVQGYSIRHEQFVPRRLYGEYLEDILNRTRKECPAEAFTWISGNATSLTMKEGKPNLGLSTGMEIQAEAVVIATGNAPPCDPPELQAIGNGYYASYAWAQSALERIPINAKVLLVGSGLTAIDQVLALRSTRFQGKIVMLSRHGRLPAAQGASCEWPSEWISKTRNTTRSIFSAVRQQVRIAGSTGSDWRSVIDSMRPFTSQIWLALPLAERKRFLRHARPFWEVARHRVPPEIHEVLRGLVNSGRLKVIAGRISSVAKRGQQVDVTVHVRGRKEYQISSVDRIINCTGSGTSVRAQGELILGLLANGLTRIDPSQLGIDTNHDGAVVNALGVPSQSVYAIGPVRKAFLWETTAVPEIRMQAIHLAQHLLSLLGSQVPTLRGKTN